MGMAGGEARSAEAEGWVAPKLAVLGRGTMSRSARATGIQGLQPQTRRSECPWRLRPALAAGSSPSAPPWLTRPTMSHLHAHSALRLQAIRFCLTRSTKVLRLSLANMQQASLRAQNPDLLPMDTYTSWIASWRGQTYSTTPSESTQF